MQQIVAMDVRWQQQQQPVSGRGLTCQSSAYNLKFHPQTSLVCNRAGVIAHCQPNTVRTQREMRSGTHSRHQQLSSQFPHQGQQQISKIAFYSVMPVLLIASDAAAATVCLDVPDWVVDWRSTVFGSPVAAVGAAGLAVVLFPKLIRTTINYLAVPAILAMLTYAAVSFPEQTANSIYTVLEFIKEHPTASSIGIIVTAGILLGPDLLAGSAVAGVLALLAVKLGVLQMPQMPQLPTVPGQGLLTTQFSHAGKALRDKLDHLDDDDQQQEHQKARSSTQTVSLEPSSRNNHAQSAPTVAESAPAAAVQTVAVAISAPAAPAPAAAAAPDLTQQGSLVAHQVWQTRHLAQVQQQQLVASADVPLY